MTSIDDTRPDEKFKVVEIWLIISIFLLNMDTLLEKMLYHLEYYFNSI